MIGTGTGLQILAGLAGKFAFSNPPNLGSADVCAYRAGVAPTDWARIVDQVGADAGAAEAACCQIGGSTSRCSGGGTPTRGRYPDPDSGMRGCLSFGVWRALVDRQSRRPVYERGMSRCWGGYRGQVDRDYGAGAHAEVDRYIRSIQGS